MNTTYTPEQRARLDAMHKQLMGIGERLAKMEKEADLMLERLRNGNLSAYAAGSDAPTATEVPS